MGELSDLLEYIYRANLNALPLIIREINRIRHERLREQGDEDENN